MIKKRIEALKNDLTASELRISDYHDLPFAIFHYDPKDELDLRKEIGLLKTQLNLVKKEVIEISLSDIFWNLLKNEGLERLFESEKEHGLVRTIDTIHGILSDEDENCFEDQIKNSLPENLSPDTILFLTRVGVLFPVYRSSAILENLHKKIKNPTILFYPGKLIGNQGLQFMGIYEPNYNYRAKIY